MQRRKASDSSAEVLRPFDGCCNAVLSRRGFLGRATKFALGSFATAAMLEGLAPKDALAQQVTKDDPRIVTEYLNFPSPQGSGTMRGYLARPAKASGKLPGVLVIHENRGLNPHTEDVARRLALENFIAFAPDALSPLGGYPGDEEAARALFAKLDPAKRDEDLFTAGGLLKSHAACTGKIGVVGFCFGGGAVNAIAVRMADLAAAVPFYGSQPSAANTARIKAPLLLHYAGLDERINAGWPAYEAALKANGIEYRMHMYPGANHSFFNDTTPRYDEAAAKLSWSRTLAFLNEKLRPSG